MQVRTYFYRSLFGASALLLTACGNSHHSDASAAATPTPPPVKVTTAHYSTLTPTEHLAGVIAPFQNVAVSSTLTEPADQVNVEEGDTVHAGQVLAVLDTADLRATLAADLATAQSDEASTSHTVVQGGLTISQGVDSYNSSLAAVDQAKATLNKDTLDLNRYQELLRNGYVSAQQVQTQQTLVQNDQKAVQAAQASAASAKSAVTANGSLNGQGLQSTSVAQARAQEQVALAQAQQERVMISKATIVSPIDGVVVNRNFNPGEYPGTRQIFTLQQVNPVYIVLHGSSAQVANVAANGNVSLVSPDARHQKMTGKVVGVLNQVNPGSTDFQVKVVVANPSNVLRPGMSIEADVALNPIRGITIPTTAFTDDSQSNVMVIGNENEVKEVKVSSLGTAGNQSLVSGLSSGSRVIANGQLGLSAGQKVAVR
jgi:HlyD family secretion protein